ncbi:Ig-like domain-containing protein [Pyxidicoccus caerfyrddinensis]|uniref:Ig-like domain-containing protein n=1 Tax=Pyxidicoccus caerfyrddinensis TaxID=2709663 RepID=UPI0013D8EF94|nr:Ig-like domain-containing protein [Pyxidicoccus caerfyrddinensis]
MPFRKWLLGSLVVVCAGCEPAQVESVEREKPTAQVQAERLAEVRGFDLREAALVAAPDGAGSRHELYFQGVPIWGLEAKTAHGVTHLTNARFAAAGHIETKPHLTQAQAEAAALAELKDPTGRVEATRLVLVPREERRRRPGAPASGRLNAEHFERVVTDLTLIYRVQMSTGEPGAERGWMARVDARSGRVLRRDSLEVNLLGDTYRKGTGYGSYSGTRSLSVLYVSTDSPPNWLKDPRGNEYQYAYRASGSRTLSYATYRGPDTNFGNGQLYSSSAGAASANGETAAVDAYYAVNMTWSFYETLLARSGPGGTGKGMRIQVHYPGDNAFYLAYSNPPSLLVGYDGYPSSASVWRPLATTDIIGHELGHDFFMREVAGLPSNFPQGTSELAGLNEGSGDISGFMTELCRDTELSGRALLDIDQTPLRSSNLTVGEQAVVGARNILTPPYSEWFDGIGDEEEHAAGGPFARMFLLLAWGCQAMPPPGAPTTGWHCPRVPGGFTGTGPLAASRIWARTVEALPMGADYVQARQAALSAAMAMDGYVGGPLMRKVGFAFAAINVGFPPENTPPAATLSCQQVAADLECTGTIADGQTPSPSPRAPVLVLDGTSTHTMPGWQFTYRFPGLAAGSHTVQLRAWDLWDNEVTRTVTVSIDKTPPQAWFTRSGPPKQPLFFVSANDASGISSVDFLQGTTLMAYVAVPPYEYGFDTSTWADGTYPMVIKVYDTFLNVTAFNYPLGVDNTPPTVALAVGTSGPPFAVTATVADASPLVRADFKVDGVLIATYATSSASYPAQYTPVDPLAHNLYVEVTDSFGNTRVVGQAAPRDLKPPDVTFSVSQTATTVTLNVGVSDTCGIQYPYSLYVDGTLKAQPTTDSHVLDLGTSVAPGEHSFRALVQDGCGNTADFQAAFTKSASPPVITGIVRDDTQPKKPKFTVQCTDTDGVHHVELRENGVVVQSDNTAPYEFVVDTTARTDGSYTVLFHCSDIHGVASTPETRTVTADNTGPGITSFSVYGSGRSYQVLAGCVDPRGVQSVTLSGGLVTPTFNVTLTQAPYGYQWFIPGTTPIQSDFPFYVTAKDTWGNTSTLSRRCYLNTASTQNAYLTCQPL